MSYHVYIAHPGITKNPIDKELWISVIHEIAEANPNFTVQKTKNRKTGLFHYTSHLTDNRKQWLSYDPRGFILAQDPCRELIEIMFVMSDKLSTSVWSEREKSYSCPEDWEKRTTKYRIRRENELKESAVLARQHEKELKREFIRNAILVLLASLTGCFIVLKYF